MLIRELLMLLTEDRNDYVIKTFGKKLQDAIDADHSARGLSVEQLVDKISSEVSSVYIIWAAKMYSLGQYKVEDFPSLKDELVLFDKVKKHLDVKDLNQYKTLNALYDATEPHADKADEKSKRQVDKDIKTKEATVFIDKPNIKVIIPKTEAASCKYGASTKWCTAYTDSKNMFNAYNAQGPLYTVLAHIDGKDRKFQLHYERNEFMNERNQPVSSSEIAALSKIPGYADFLNKLIELHYVPHIKANKK